MIKRTLYTIPLFELDSSFNGCAVIPFPENGIIKDIYTFGNTAMLLVEAEPNVSMIAAHFHAVNVNLEIESESTLEYIGLFVFPQLGKMIPVYRLDGEPQEIELTPLNTKEMYDLFGIKKPKRKYTRKKKDDNT